MKKPTQIIIISTIGLILLVTAFTHLQLATAVEFGNRVLTPRSSESSYGLLPTENVPTGTLNITQGETSIILNIEDIVNRTTLENATIPLHQWEINIEDVWHNITGIDPLQLFDLVKFSYCTTFRFWGINGTNRSLDVEELILHDSDYYGDSVNNATILALAVDDQWIGTFDESYGNAVLFGDDYTEEMIIKDVNKITLETEWIVDITVDDIKVGEISRLNRTDELLNYTTYSWEYSDNKSGKSWGPFECTGYTIASIVSKFLSQENYTVSVIAIDGYGANKKYTKIGIEEGFTGVEINDPAIPLSNEGKLAILMDIVDSNPIDYSNGAYRFVAPGLVRSDYISQIVEVRILTIPPEETTTTTPTPEPSIVGYGFEILLGCFIFAVAVILLRRSRR